MDVKAKISEQAAQLGFLRPLLTYRDYRFLWISSVLTQIAQWMLQVATGWLMLELTNSALWVGMLGFAGGIPFLFVAAPAGALAERYDRRQILLVSQVSSFLVTLGLALSVLAQHATPLLLLLATLANGALLAANNATRQTLLPEYVPHPVLQSAVALLAAGVNTTRILGPSLAGPLVATFGSGRTLLFQAAVLLLALLHTIQLPPALPATQPTAPFLSTLVGGFAYLQNTPLVQALLILACVPTILVFPYLHLLPVFARDILHLGPSGLGLLYTVGGVGAVSGSLFIASFREMRRRGLAMVVMIVVYGGVISLFTLSRWLPFTLLCLFCGGFLGASYMALNNALLHLVVDNEVRGRVMGLYTITWGFMPLGALPMGGLADLVGIPTAILIGALASSLFALLIAWRVPDLLRLP